MADGVRFTAMRDHAIVEHSYLPAARRFEGEWQKSVNEAGKATQDHAHAEARGDFNIRFANGRGVTNKSLDMR